MNGWECLCKEAHAYTIGADIIFSITDQWLLSNVRSLTQRPLRQPFVRTTLPHTDRLQPKHPIVILCGGSNANFISFLHLRKNNSLICPLRPNPFIYGLCSGHLFSVCIFWLIWATLLSPDVLDGEHPGVSNDITYFWLGWGEFFHAETKWRHVHV